MKKLLLSSVIAASLLAGCSRNSYPETRYPSPQPYPYPAPQPSPRDEPVVVTKDGRVISADGRVIGNAGNLPPGQAKKVYGSKSAKVYAPGQRKKQGNVYNNFPPSRIQLDDRYAQQDNYGRLYYIDQNGYVYWRGNDRYYYLDSKYQNDKRKNKDYDDDDRDRAYSKGNSKKWDSD